MGGSLGVSAVEGAVLAVFARRGADAVAARVPAVLRAVNRVFAFVGVTLVVAADRGDELLRGGL